jgi:hypothetical protein
MTQPTLSPDFTLKPKRGLMTANAYMTAVLECRPDWIERMNLDWAEDYAEPGYSADPRGVLFANWNDVTKWDGEKHKVLDTRPRRLQAIAEHAGYSIEWGDEFMLCDDCHKAVRTTADSYGWKRSYFENDNGIQCINCVKDDPSEYLASLEGDSRRAETMDLDLTDHGYVLAGKDYEHGWHPGQNDSPEVVAKSLRARGIDRFLFKIDDVGQFDLKFSVYVHEDEKDLLTEAPVDSALSYDPGTEMGKALRGEPSKHYTMTTRTLQHSAIQACPIHSFAPDHYREDGTCRCAKETS